MLDFVKGLLPEILKQMPAVVMLFIIMLHMQYQIDTLFAQCIVLMGNVP